jgi:hypothetical protein
MDCAVLPSGQVMLLHKCGSGVLIAPCFSLGRCLSGKQNRSECDSAREELVEAAQSLPGVRSLGGVRPACVFANRMLCPFNTTVRAKESG